MKTSKETYLKENLEIRMKNSWMTQDFLNLMQNRRKNKMNIEEYRRINKIRKKEIRFAKERESILKCQEIASIEFR